MDDDGRRAVEGEMREALCRGERVRLAYPWHVTRAVYEGQRQALPDQRVMIQIGELEPANLSEEDGRGGNGFQGFGGGHDLSEVKHLRRILFFGRVQVDPV